MRLSESNITFLTGHRINEPPPRNSSNLNLFGGPIGLFTQYNNGRYVALPDFINGCIKQLDRKTNEVIELIGRCSDQIIDSDKRISAPHLEYPSSILYLEDKQQFIITDLGLFSGQVRIRPYSLHFGNGGTLKTHQAPVFSLWSLQSMKSPMFNHLKTCIDILSWMWYFHRKLLTILAD